MNANFWSLQFCCYVFGVTGNAADTWEKGKIRFFRSKTDPAVGLAEATRMIRQRHGLDIDPISFIVESTRDEFGESRHFFIKFKWYPEPFENKHV